MAIIPSLFKTRLHHVGFCAFIDKSNSERVWAENSSSVEIDCEVTAGRRKHRISLDIEPPNEDGEIHVHINLARLEALDTSALGPPKGTVGELGAALSRLYGTLAIIRTNGSYFIPSVELPKDGLVKAISNVSTSIGESKLSLSGAEVSITGGDSIQKITWSKVDDIIMGKIFAKSETVFHEGVMQVLVSNLDQGASKFILNKDGA